MMMVDRYEAYGDRGDAIMCKEDDGSWVDYDDYQAQAARIEQLEAALATARNDALREAAASNRKCAEFYDYDDRCDRRAKGALAMANAEITALMTKDTQ